MQRYRGFSWPWHLWHDMGHESSELRLCWIWGNQFADLHGGTRAEGPSSTWCGTVRTRRIIPPQDFSSPLLIDHRFFAVLIIDVLWRPHDEYEYCERLRAHSVLQLISASWIFLQLRLHRS